VIAKIKIDYIIEIKKSHIDSFNENSRYNYGLMVDRLCRLPL